MIKWFAGLTLILVTTIVFSDEAPIGFLWYNAPKAPVTEKEQKPQGVSFSQLSYTQRDKVLHFYTMEALHRARQTKSMEDMREFLALQD